MKCVNCRYGIYAYYEEYEEEYYVCTIDHSIVPIDVANDDNVKCDLYEDVHNDDPYFGADEA